jgi:hypothetical protein
MRLLGLPALLGLGALTLFLSSAPAEAGGGGRFGRGFGPGVSHGSRFSSHGWGNRSFSYGNYGNYSRFHSTVTYGNGGCYQPPVCVPQPCAPRPIYRPVYRPYPGYCN